EALPDLRLDADIAGGLAGCAVVAAVARDRHDVRLERRSEPDLTAQREIETTRLRGRSARRCIVRIGDRERWGGEQCDDEYRSNHAGHHVPPRRKQHVLTLTCTGKAMRRARSDRTSRHPVTLRLSQLLNGLLASDTPQRNAQVDLDPR